MHSTDPMLPIWFIALVILGFAFGYIAGRLTPRPARRRNHHWTR